MTIVCSHCGTTNRQRSNFCNNCGADLRADQADVVRPPSLAEGTGTGDDALDENQAAMGAVQPSDRSLSPLFDLGLASPAGVESDDLIAAQPWLASTADASTERQSAASLEEGSDASPFPMPGTRLVAGVQGLLAPLNLSSTADGMGMTTTVHGAGLSQQLTADQERRVRSAMGVAPAPDAHAADMEAQTIPSLRIHWVFLIIGIAIGLPVLGMVGGPVGTPQTWPGATEAYNAIEALPNGADVWIYFAYDPAMAGEMDVVAAPVVRHLLARRSNLTLFSLSPTAPATARRLILGLLPAELTAMERTVAMRRILVRNHYLSGGAAVLPLVGSAPERFIDASPLAAAARPGTFDMPDLTIILAADSEDVQHWLELVQPRNRVPVVAATSAGVDPLVRPYLDSGQLRGLVSGFDGAAAYAAWIDLDPSPQILDVSRRQMLAQNWGHIALFLILVFGNLASYFRRIGHDQKATHG